MITFNFDEWKEYLIKSPSMDDSDDKYIHNVKCTWYIIARGTFVSSTRASTFVKKRFRRKRTCKTLP